MQRFILGDTLTDIQSNMSPLVKELNTETDFMQQYNLYWVIENHVSYETLTENIQQCILYLRQKYRLDLPKSSQEYGTILTRDILITNPMIEVEMIAWVKTFMKYSLKGINYLKIYTVGKEYKDIDDNYRASDIYNMTTGLVTDRRV